MPVRALEFYSGIGKFFNFENGWYPLKLHQEACI